MVSLSDRDVVKAGQQLQPATLRPFVPFVQVGTHHDEQIVRTCIKFVRLAKGTD